jgi:hypothetical protein
MFNKTKTVKTVDDILKGFTQTIADLKALEELHDNKAKEIETQLLALDKEHEASIAESARASNVASKIAGLISG